MADDAIEVAIQRADRVVDEDRKEERPHVSEEGEPDQRRDDQPEPDPEDTLAVPSAKNGHGPLRRRKREKMPVSRKKTTIETQALVSGNNILVDHPEISWAPYPVRPAGHSKYSR